MTRNEKPYKTCNLVYFQQNTDRLIEQLKASGRSLVLTVDGQPKVVVQDLAAYQRMCQIVEHAEATMGIRKGLASMKQGSGILLSDAVESLRRKHYITQQN